MTLAEAVAAAAELSRSRLVAPGYLGPHVAAAEPPPGWLAGCEAVAAWLRRLRRAQNARRRPRSINPRADSDRLAALASRALGVPVDRGQLAAGARLAGVGVAQDIADGRLRFVVSDAELAVAEELAAEAAREPKPAPAPVPRTPPPPPAPAPPRVSRPARAPAPPPPSPAAPPPEPDPADVFEGVVLLRRAAELDLAAGRRVPALVLLYHAADALASLERGPEESAGAAFRRWAGRYLGGLGLAPADLYAARCGVLRALMADPACDGGGVDARSLAAAFDAGAGAYFLELARDPARLSAARARAGAAAARVTPYELVRHSERLAAEGAAVAARAVDLCDFATED